MANTTNDLDILIQNAPKYVPPPAKEEPGIIKLHNDHPDTLAATFEEHSPVKHRYNSIDGWSIYHNDRYQLVPDDKEIDRYIRAFLLSCRIKQRGDKKEDGTYRYYYAKLPKAAKSAGYVNNIKSWLRDLSGVHLLPSQNAPCALEHSFAGKTIIAMQNGLLDVTDYNKPTLLSHSPGYYTHNYLPFNYDPEATCPTWLWALGEYFQNEDGSPDTLVPNILHAWFKKIVFRNTSHQKIFGLLGRRRSGKGTIGRTLTRMLGTANVAPITVNLLCNAFGLQPLLNKQLAIMWDASVTGRASNTRTAVEVMKNISGEDTFTVNRKNQPLLTDVKLQLSLFVIANEVLDLRDSTGALAGRFTFLETTKSFYGHEDPTVEEKIATELPGIFNQVMAAPEGRLQEHPRSQRIQEEFEEISSPFLAFIHEWCDVSDPDAFIPKEIMWMYYSDWAKRNNHGEPCPQTFKPRFLGCHDAIYDYRPPILTDDDIYRLRDEYRLDRKSDRRVDLVGRPRCYKGIDLKQSIKKLWDVQV